MTAATPSGGDDAFVWDTDLPKAKKSDSPAEGEPETYSIPGGLSGWSPGDIPPPNSDGTIRKTPPRNEPTPPVAPTARKPKRSVARYPRWELLGFNLLVFVSSVCVMTLELTASRLIAKHVGSSLYTWTSVIGVVLAGITFGNYLGGWLADRFSRARTLAWMFLLSSMACASVLWLDQVVSRIERPDYFDWPTWVLCVVTMMFLLPALLLGTTSPLVASMALERGTKTGSTVGNVYAWGAFGSIIGTFLTGFYLIDIWGTRSIIGMTAATLALLAIVVAGGRWTFRTAVVVGWLQFLTFLWVAATITSPTAAGVAGEYGKLLTKFSPEMEHDHILRYWPKFGDSLGGKLHELGLILHLRDDELDAFHDESSYSYIQVRDDYIEGVPVRALRLDKLDHSYFDPNEPTKLHYEYEEVYAAITHRAAPQPAEQLTAKVPQFPGRDELMTRLPAGVMFDPATELLTVPSAEPVLLKSLRELSRDAVYWNAVEELHRETNRVNWGGFTTVAIDELPAGVTIPRELNAKIRFDVNLQSLSAYESISLEDRDRLCQLGTQAPWRTAIDGLSKQSAAISTLFIGGGGFIFPRWVVAEFPAVKRVDVAELDPAVYQAVRQEMGFTAADEQRINTVLGDARNFVEDRVRANTRAALNGEPAVTYDFIYGDAFNDFSVPWHLTTQEFTQKVYDLLTPHGVFLANIIEIYPRTVIPGGTAEEVVAELTTTPPEALFAPPEAGQQRQVQSQFGPLQIQGGSQLQFAGVLSEQLEERLKGLAPEDAAWQTAIGTLAAKSRAPRPLPMRVPSGLIPETLYAKTWTQCPSPFEGVDIYELAEHQHMLGLRGVAPVGLCQKVLDLQPSDSQWKLLINEAADRSEKVAAGRFLGRYVNTMTHVFPYVAVFATSASHPSESRDTFVVACARTPLDLRDLPSRGTWEIKPFAEFVRSAPDATPELRGQMESLLELANGNVLTDDFAPVDNLLRPVFVDQDL